MFNLSFKIVESLLSLTFTRIARVLISRIVKTVGLKIADGELFLIYFSKYINNTLFNTNTIQLKVFFLRFQLVSIYLAMFWE